ncbi:MAG: hypothetical protein ACOC8E_00360 [Planctomycetota bacterium]
MKSLRPVVLLVALFGFTGATTAADIPSVRDERPRLILRATAWQGPSVEKLKSWLGRPEYRKHLGRLGKKGMMGALRYRILGDDEAGTNAVNWIKNLKKPEKRPKDSPSYTGIALTQDACVYDWLRDHPDLKDPATRKGAVEYFEWWGDYFKRYLSPGVVPFYSRNSGALAGLTAVGLTLHGDSDKAAGYIAHARKYLKENMGTIRQAEDGATGGATYGLVHQFIDLANIAMMWRSATDWDAAAWIKQNQGNWLERQMLFQIYATYPTGQFWKEGDVWSHNHTDRYEHATQVAAIAWMYDNPYGRRHVTNIHKRYGVDGSYYKSRILWFFLYNNPEQEAKPLSGLPRCEVFSPKLHAYVFWRSSWEADGTVVTFKSGENVDHHGTWDTGKFTIFKRRPLAIKSGAYRGGYMGQFHHFYKLPYSANCVIFDHPKTLGWQPRMPDADGHTSWTDWKAWREKKVRRPYAGRLLKHEVTEDAGYALGDLSGSTYPSGSTWLREMLFLGYKYVVVLDRVKPGADTTTKWLLQAMEPVTIDAEKRLTIVDNRGARLFCKTLLPEKVAMKDTGVIDGERKGKPAKLAYTYPYRKWREKKRRLRAFPAGWFRDRPQQMVGHGRLEVIPDDPTAECVYLHVLYPTTTETGKMPACSVEKKGDTYTVTVGELSYTFEPPQTDE